MTRLSVALGCWYIQWICQSQCDFVSAWSAPSSSVSSVSSTPTITTSMEPSPSRCRIQEALRSLSGKPTITPEIVIPEPTDPTVLLLRSTQVTQLSCNIRTKAKANAACVVGSIDALRTFCTEQETAGRGQIPGPIPIIYNYQSFVCGNIKPTMEHLAKAGVIGFIHPICQSLPITNLEMVLHHGDDLKQQVQEAKKYGIQVIPEVIVPNDLKKNTGDTIQEADWITLVDTLTSILDGCDPVAILLTIQESSSTDTTTAATLSSSSEHESTLTLLPKIPKSLTKRLPVVGSIRVMAGQNRMGSAVAAYKAAGFTGNILRYCINSYLSVYF